MSCVLTHKRTKALMRGGQHAAGLSGYFRPVDNAIHYSASHEYALQRSPGGVAIRLQPRHLRAADRADGVYSEPA